MDDKECRFGYSDGDTIKPNHDRDDSDIERAVAEFHDNRHPCDYILASLMGEEVPVKYKEKMYTGRVTAVQFNIDGTIDGLVTAPVEVNGEILPDAVFRLGIVKNDKGTVKWSVHPMVRQAILMTKQDGEARLT